MVNCSTISCHNCEYSKLLKELCSTHLNRCVYLFKCSKYNHFVVEISGEEIPMDKSYFLSEKDAEEYMNKVVRLY